MKYPKTISHWINGEISSSTSKKTFNKIDPASGKTLGRVVSGDKKDVNKAILSALRAYPYWSETPIIQRGKILREGIKLLSQSKRELAEIVALESGKSKEISLGEVEAAIECGHFFAGESQRFYGKTLQSSNLRRSVKLIRNSIGVGALFVPFNNPAASIAWKTFPALLCGNSVVLKSHEYTPYTAIFFAKILKKAGLPDGVFNVIQGTGLGVGVPLSDDERISFISFTGSSRTGADIVRRSAEHLPKISIEAGGKNPIVVCDDADLEHAVNEVVSAAFVDAGQRCAAASRIIVFNKVYKSFKTALLKKVKKLSIGTSNSDDFGAIISGQRLNDIYGAVERAKKKGAKILYGGKIFTGGKYKSGFFMAPTILENVDPHDEIAQEELFGPVVVLFSAKNYKEAVFLANSAKYKLSSAIHTKSIDRAESFVRDSEAGVVRVNGATHGSEPHMPFGGLGLSGNGFREPGEEALNFYSEWKQVTVDYNRDEV